METKLSWFQTKQFRLLLFVLILAVGMLVRLVGLGVMPEGVEQDEAMAAYQAYTTLTEGIDLHGYHNPVYFEAWGQPANGTGYQPVRGFVLSSGVTLR